MCTTSWIFEQNGYQLLCNRDESHNRKPAVSPTIRTSGGVRYIAPIDGDRGGSWLSVNEYGLSLSLLNRYPDAGPNGSSTISRGLLVTELAGCGSTAETLARIEQMDVQTFRPFTLALIEPNVGVIRLDWDGCQVRIKTPADQALPLTSSSWDTARVIRSRRVAYHRLTARSPQLDAETLWKFHSSHSPARGPYSVCMHRSDARTVSFCWISVTEDLVEFRYCGDSPCLATPQSFSVTRLPLKGSSRDLTDSPQFQQSQSTSLALV